MLPSRSPLALLPSLSCLLVVTLYAARAGAPPPLSGFPADLRPTDGTAAPPNARAWIFGKDAPPLAQIGVAVAEGGTPVDVTLAALGCCGVNVTPITPFSDGATVQVTASSAGGELSASFVVAGADDVTAPTLAEPVVLDDSGGALVLGVGGDDDGALAGFLARSGPDVVGAGPPGRVLEATPGPDGCVDVVAVDLAGNESVARRACRAPVPDDGGVLADGGAEPVTGCSQGCGGSGELAALFAPLFWLRLRRRGDR